MTELPDLELNKGAAAAALTEPARKLHQWVLTTFAATGRAPARADVQRMARERGLDADPALAELVARDVLAVDGRGEIRAAYPFSPTPTRHQVSWAGGPTVYAMCAVDALGVSAMLERPVTITSAEPGSGATITVEVEHDHARWHPHTAVVFAGVVAGEPCCPSVDRSCGHINFFTSAEAAHTWAAERPDITGTLLDQHHALACGIAEFAALLQPA